MHDLTSNDTISYSAGAKSNDPFQYRIVKPIDGLFSAVARHVPKLIGGLIEQPPLVIQSYPATLAIGSIGPKVDTYLNPQVASRALTLAAVSKRNALICSTPLLAAQMLQYHVQAEGVFPRQIILACGGYPLPLSLERAMQAWIAARNSTLAIVQFYGQAEIDAACLFSVNRDDQGNALYHPRDGIEVREENGQVSLFMNGHRAAFEDHFENSSQGLIIRNQDRWNSAAFAEVERWSAQDWHRRTGYLLQTLSGEYRFQLREWTDSGSPEETNHYDFSKESGMTWWQKPKW